jgi:hypothetical protein
MTPSFFSLESFDKLSVATIDASTLTMKDGMTKV